MQGSNTRKLIAARIAFVAIPPNGSFEDGMRFLQSPERIIRGAREAAVWAQVAIAAVKSAPDNPWGDDDEAIAGEILWQMKHDERDDEA
jgi:hypothetical protein